MQRKNYLDSVRAIAALMVVTVHTQQFFNAQWRPAVMLAAMGQLGVQLFFVLSAFLIFESLDRIQKNGGTLTEFFVHRFFRIAPLYYVAIIVNVLTFGFIFPALHWSHHAPDAYTPGNILANVLLLHGLIPSANNSVVGGGWSIGTEVIFYVLAPAMFALRNRPMWLVAMGAACFPIVYLLIGTVQPALGAPAYVNDNGFLFFSIFNQMPVFVCGALLFVFKERIFKIPLVLSVLAVAALIPFTYHVWLWHFDGLMTFTFIPLLAGIAGVFFISAMAKINFSNWLFREFGKRSFSIYLSNFPAILIVRTIGLHANIKIPFPVAVMAVATLAFLIAGVTYRYVEKPCMQLAKKMAQPKAAPSGSPAV